MTPLKFSELRTIRQAGHVLRWHTELGINQNNAAHTWHALMLLLILEPNISRDAIVYMQMHDVAEVLTGDFPAPVKWQYPELKELLTRIEKDNARQIGYEEPSLNAYEKVLIKFCDSAELVLTCHEHALMGNRYALIPGIKVLHRMRQLWAENIDLLRHNERVNDLLGYLERRYYHVHNVKSQRDTDWR